MDGVRVMIWPEIREVLPGLELLPEIEAGFVSYSQGRAVIPPVGELRLRNPPGDVHIKYGYIEGENFYVIKIASGFYENPRRNLPSGHGMMLLFYQETGTPACVLLDEGHLTDIRTAVAGAIAAKYLGPRAVDRIGIVGTGTQARLQLEYLQGVTDCRRVVVWGRSTEKQESYRHDMGRLGFEVELAADPAQLASRSNLIVTTTPATSPLLTASDVGRGVHITAVGSDTPEKQELDPTILGRADRVVADSLSQCRERGEISHALRAAVLREESIAELGAIIEGRAKGRETPDQITIADLTGVAVQDLQIAKAVYLALKT